MQSFNTATLRVSCFVHVSDYWDVVVRIYVTGRRDDGSWRNTWPRRYAWGCLPSSAYADESFHQHAVSVFLTLSPCYTTRTCRGSSVHSYHFHCLSLCVTLFSHVIHKLHFQHGLFQETTKWTASWAFVRFYVYFCHRFHF